MTQLARNVLSNWGSMAFRVVVGLWLTPFIIGSLGAAHYGLWVLVGSLVGYFDLLDLGVRSALIRYAAQARARGDESGLEEVSRQAMGASLAAGLAGFALFTGLGFALRDFLASGVALAPGAFPRLVLLVSLNLAVGFPLAYYSGLVSAAKRYDLANAIGVVVAIARAGGVILVLRAGHGIVGLAATMLVTGAAHAIALRLAARRFYPGMSMRASVPRGATARALISYGLSSLLLQVAVRIVYYTDNVVIAAFLTKSAVATYAIGGALIFQLRGIVAAMTNVLAPDTSEMDARGETERLRTVLIRGTLLTLVVALPILATFFLDQGRFIRLWVGREFDASVPILQVLALGQLVALPQLTAGVILYGMNRHRANAFIAVGEAAANLVLSILLVRSIGAVGVAWGTTLPLLVTQTVVLPAYVCRLLDLSPWRWFRHGYLPALAASVVYAVALRAAMVMLDPGSMAGYFGCVLLALAPYGIVVTLWVVDADMRALLLPGRRRAG